MAAKLVSTEPIGTDDSNLPFHLLLVRADQIQRGDYVKGEYGWERVLKVGGEKVGVDFIYLYFGRERIGYEYWDCYKSFPETLRMIGRKEAQHGSES
jgi:hypothetical protein